MQLRFFSQKTTVTRDLLERFLNIQYTKFENCCFIEIFNFSGLFLFEKTSKREGWVVSGEEHKLFGRDAGCWLCEDYKPPWFLRVVGFAILYVPLLGDCSRGLKMMLNDANQSFYLMSQGDIHGKSWFVAMNFGVDGWNISKRVAN